MAVRHARIVMLAAASLLAGSCSGNDTQQTVEASTTTVKAASTSGGDPAAKPGGDLVVGVEASPENIDPLAGTGGSSVSAAALAMTALYNSIGTRDGDGKLVPELAESWTSSADFATWTVMLRPEATFSDGTPVDAAAIVANYTVRADESMCQCAPVFAGIHAAATDDATVTFTLDTPNARFPDQRFFDAIMAPSTLTAGTDRERAPVGSGPFLLTDRDRLEFTKNASYWKKDSEGRQLPYLDSFRVSPIQDPKVRLTALQKGELDVMESFDGPTLNEAKGDKKLNVQVSAGDTIVIIGNQSRPAISDPDVREALALAVDRDALAASYLPDAFAPTYSFVAADSPFKIETEFPRYDAAAAKKLVEKVKARGDDEHLKVRIVCAKLPEAEALLAVAVNQLKDVGIQAELSMLDVGEYAAQVLAGGGEWDLACTRLAAIRSDPAGLGEFLIGGRPGNVAKYASPEVDRLFAEDQTESDQTKREDTFEKIVAALVKDLPYVPLLTANNGLINGPKAHNVIGIDLGWPTKPAIEVMWASGD